jgi:hypothetical protein
MRRIALAFLLLLLLVSAVAEAVQTTVKVTAPAGPPVGNATLQIFDSEGELVAEEETDEDGTVVIDLPEGDYTAETIDGAHSIDFKAGETASFVIPLLYGILDDVEALTEYFQNFDGSAFERLEAWGMLDDDIAKQVERILDAEDDALFDEPEEGAAPDAEQGARGERDDGVFPGSELAAILDDVDALTAYFQNFQGCGSTALWAWEQLDPEIAKQVRANLGAARQGAAPASSAEADFEAMLSDPDAMTEYFKNFQGCGTQRLNVWNMMDDDVARQVSENLKPPPQRPASGGVAPGSELAGILNDVDALTAYFQDFQGCGSAALWAWEQLDPEIARQVQENLGARRPGTQPASTPEAEFEAMLRDPDAMTEYFRNFQGCGTQRLNVWKMMDPEVAREVSDNLDNAPARVPGGDAEFYAGQADQSRATAARATRTASAERENAETSRANAQRWRDEAAEAREKGQEDAAAHAEERALLAEKNAEAAEAAAAKAERRARDYERYARGFDEKAAAAARREAPPPRTQEAPVAVREEGATPATGTPEPGADIDALAEYFENFEGSGRELDDAWSRLDPATRAKVEARIRETTNLPAGDEEVAEEGREETDTGAEAGDTEDAAVEQGAEESVEEAESGVDEDEYDIDMSEFEFFEDDNEGESEEAIGEEGDAIGTGEGQTGQIPNLEYELRPAAEQDEDEDDDTWTDPRDDEETALGGDVDITTGDPTSLNPPGSNGATNPAVQKMVVEISIDGQSVTIPAGKSAAVRILAPPRLARASAQSSFAGLGSFPLASMSRSGAIDFAVPAVGVAAPAQRDSQAPSQSALQVLLTNNGSSTGEAFTARIFNPGSAPLNIKPGALVVEALKDKAGQKVQKELAKLVGPRMPDLPSLSLDAYCLEFLRLPHEAGTIFRIAQSQIQQQFQQSRAILKASRELYNAGKLHPDVAPEEYFHSIRQWALWTDEQGFDSKSFADAFIKHTRKNLEAAGGKWNKQYEKVLRGATGGRWSDIQAILEAAGDS